MRLPRKGNTMNYKDKINHLLDKRGYKYNPRYNPHFLTKKMETGWREIDLDNLDIVYELDNISRRTGKYLHILW
jgi:hypothetical protein